MTKPKQLFAVRTPIIDTTKLLICHACNEDPTIFCPRNVDVMCLDCGDALCGGHILDHLKSHCISLSLDHCRTPQPTKGTKP